jgi:hypothetical protein
VLFVVKKDFFNNPYHNDNKSITLPLLKEQELEDEVIK